MYYLYFEFEGTETWMELDENHFAFRQINRLENGTIQVSCKEDCLAEKSIEPQPDDTIISKNDFENEWIKAIEPIRENWSQIKQKYSLNSTVKGVIKYFYPQGAILDFEYTQGLTDINSSGLHSNDKVTGIVVGYDEVNMWLLIAEVVVEKNNS